MSEIKQVLVDQKAILERKFEKERIIERGIPDLKNIFHSQTRWQYLESGGVENQHWLKHY